MENHDFNDSEGDEAPEMSKQDKIIADEAEEIQKIIEEGEKAAKDVESQKAAMPAPEQEPESESKSENTGTWKWFFAGIIIVLAIGIFFIGSKYADVLQIRNIHHTGPLATLAPEEFLDGWKVTGEYTTLAELPLEKKQEFFEMKNLDDVATWEFAKGDSSIFVWLRDFADNSAAKVGADSFGAFAWRSEVLPWNLPFGNAGKAGIYRVTGHDPLMAYVIQDDKILSVAYYNTKNEEYDATKLSEDRVFITGITRKIMGKAMSLDGKELAVPNINTE